MANLLSSAQFFSEACGLSASFARVRAEHIELHGELLTYVLMGDLLRFVGSGVGGEETLDVMPPSIDEVRDLLALVDLGFVTGDFELQNVLSVSFVEGIDGEPFFLALSPLLGPAALGEISRQQQYRDAL